jgi:hypothetical protein
MVLALRVETKLFSVLRTNPVTEFLTELTRPFLERDHFEKAGQSCQHFGRFDGHDFRVKGRRLPPSFWRPEDGRVSAFVRSECGTVRRPVLRRNRHASTRGTYPVRTGSGCWNTGGRSLNHRPSAVPVRPGPDEHRSKSDRPDNLLVPCERKKTSFRKMANGRHRCDQNSRKSISCADRRRKARAEDYE